MSAAEVAAALATFPGLPHRLEEIGRLGRTLYINDSKATNADSAATALAAFDRDVFWILGGRPKQGGITSAFSQILALMIIGQILIVLAGYAYGVQNDYYAFPFAQMSMFGAICGLLLGLGLLGLSSGTKFVVTGGVLLLAVTVDSISRRGREQSGRA